MIPPLVDAEWVKRHGGEIVLADVRWYLDGRSGHQAYASGHLPGAVFVDLDSALAGPPGTGGGRHPLPEPAAFAAAMTALGIGDDTVVVGYDDAGGVTAARLVWMLRVTGHDAALLDGGLGGYAGPLETAEPHRTPARFTARPWPADRLADADDAASGANVVIDARPRPRFRGVEEPVDSRAGHIPGARSLPCRENLDARGRFLPRDALRRRFAAVGVDDGRRVVSYCGSGVTACHNLLALEICGLGPGRLYPGSWSEYSALFERPVETGEGSWP